MPAGFGTDATAGAPAATPKRRLPTAIAGTSVGDAVCSAAAAANTEMPVPTSPCVLRTCRVCVSLVPPTNAVIFLPANFGASGASGMAWSPAPTACCVALPMA